MAAAFEAKMSVGVSAFFSLRSGDLYDGFRTTLAAMMRLPSLF
jgi:hypothetical protein